MIDPQAFLEAVSGYGQAKQASSATRTPRLGSVDPAYASGSPKVKFDGDTVLSLQGFARLASYTPAAGDRVLLLPVGNSYVVIGKVV